jgi:ribosomal-protein-alanine N-acetyltransferase
LVKKDVQFILFWGGWVMNLSVVFDRVPILETPRLRLRDLRLSDHQSVFELFHSAEVVRYYDVDQFTQFSQADELINALNRRYQRRQSVRWGITLLDAPDCVIGTCGFNTFDTEAHYAEIGYDLHPAHWRQGIMTEAVAAMTRFGFFQIGLNRIEANVMIGNDASVAVLTKLGFRFEGVMRQRAYWKGKYHDLEWYSLLREDLPR